MTYLLGRRSRNELVGVHADLVALVERAIVLTEQDFAVHDGLRTVAEQTRLVAAGASKTMASRHLQGTDGYGHAVDLVPIVGGKLRWEWPAAYPIAEAMRQAAQERGIPLRWGGTWKRIDNTTEPIVELHKASAGWDAPHFELPRGAKYP